MAKVSPPPIKEPLFDGAGRPSKIWATWFRDMYIRSGGSASDVTLEEHIADPIDAHEATAIRFSPTALIAAVTVQAAIDEAAIEATAGIAAVQADVDAIEAALPGLEGDSAYQVAVTNGFIGTEAEWLDSLVGPTGATGNTGPQGVPGSAGPQGPMGPPGGAVDTSFVVSSLLGHIYTNALNGNAYLLS
jgi:hypothetical protein